MELFLLCAIAMTVVAFISIVLTNPSIDSSAIYEELSHPTSNQLISTIELDLEESGHIAKRIPINSRKNKLVNQ